MKPGLMDKVAGVIFGTAIGDALGYPVEFLGVEERRRKYPKGIREYLRFVKGAAQYSDDTQMMRAVLEGLLRTKERGDVGKAAEEVAEEFIAWSKSPENNRAPGNACMAGCAQLAANKDWRFAGDPEALGSGAAMRSMAYALWWPDNPVEAGRWAALHARMTHGHPGAQEAAFLTAVTTVVLMQGARGRELEKGIFEMAGMYDHDTATLVHAAWRMSFQNIRTEEILEELPGWRSDHAIAAAIVCAARGQTFLDAVSLAVTNCGDADTVGAITGALRGASDGISGIPSALGEKIENGKELAVLSARVTDRLSQEVACPSCATGEPHEDEGDSNEQVDADHLH